MLFASWEGEGILGHILLIAALLSICLQSHTILVTRLHSILFDSWGALWRNVMHCWVAPYLFTILSYDWCVAPYLIIILYYTALCYTIVYHTILQSSLCSSTLGGLCEKYIVHCCVAPYLFTILCYTLLYYTLDSSIRQGAFWNIAGLLTYLLTTLFLHYTMLY